MSKDHRVKKRLQNENVHGYKRCHNEWQAKHGCRRPSAS